jgi:hypothetical protein
MPLEKQMYYQKDKCYTGIYSHYIIYTLLPWSSCFLAVLTTPSYFMFFLRLFDVSSFCFGTCNRWLYYECIDINTDCKSMCYGLTGACLRVSEERASIHERCELSSRFEQQRTT